MRKLIVVGLTLLLVGSAAVALAAIPDSGGVIHGCRKNTDGSLRVIDSEAGQSCPNGYTALNWRQDGIDAHAIVRSVQDVPIGYSEPHIQAVAPCPGGKQALGGGGAGPADSGGSRWVMKDSEPAINTVQGQSVAIGWVVTMTNLGAPPENDASIIVWAICADVDGSL